MPLTKKTEKLVRLYRLYSVAEGNICTFYNFKHTKYKGAVKLRAIQFHTSGLTSYEVIPGILGHNSRYATDSEIQAMRIMAFPEVLT